MIKFEIWQSTHNKNWYWHLKAANGERVAQGEGYATKQGAETAVNWVKQNAYGAPVTYL